MFDGIPEQSHQFVASRTAQPLPHHPLSFYTLHGSSSATTFPAFDPYYCHHQLPLQPHFLHDKDGENQENNSGLVNVDTGRANPRSVREPMSLWSNDEVLALFRIRSALENWLPDFTWEHVSRKLAEFGFKRSPQNCREKFEEESRFFNSINYSKSRFSGELEELYNGDRNPGFDAEKTKMQKNPIEEDKILRHNFEEASTNETRHPFEDKKKLVENSKSAKRKRQLRFKKFKSFCEDVAERLMAQQEELHKKLLAEMEKREEETIAREEAWKKEERERINREIEIMAQEKAIAVERQIMLSEYLEKLAVIAFEQRSFESSNNEDQPLPKVQNGSIPSTSSSLIMTRNPSPSSKIGNQYKLEISSPIIGHANYCSSRGTHVLASENPTTALPPNVEKASPTSSTKEPSSQNHNSLDNQNNPLAAISFSMQNLSHNHKNPSDKNEIGKRWTRDEVLALINLRCNLHNSYEDKEAATKIPTWERISHGMLDLGYKRSAKRCKEKWENMNKYFRKTRDVNKNRSLDSRTCPYFRHLSTLYKQGKMVAASQGPELGSGLPETSFSSS